jgi:Uma2 family endonuclease
MTAKLPEIGPLRADQFRPGDRYELDNGHPVYCAPAGGSHATPNLIGAAAVATDPKVKEAGVDAGFAPRPHVLRAPDVAIGNVPNAPGWVQGAPELAIEYADVGQDEAELERKIRDLLAAGTQYLWVVRLTGPRRVEVHERGKARPEAQGQDCALKSARSSFSGDCPSSGATRKSAAPCSGARA